MLQLQLQYVYNLNRFVCPLDDGVGVADQADSEQSNASDESGRGCWGGSEGVFAGGCGNWVSNSNWVSG